MKRNSVGLGMIDRVETRDEDKTKEDLLTELRDSRSKAVRAEELLMTALDSLPHAFCLIDIGDYSIRLANASLRGSMQPDTMTCYQALHGQDTPCDEPGCMCPIQEVTRTKQPVRLQHLHETAKGEPTIVDVFATPLLDAEGEVTHVAHYSYDLSEIRKLEAQLIRAQKLEAVGRMSAGMAHDFGNVLAGIIGCAQIAAEKIDTSHPSRLFLDEIAASAKRATALTRRLLDCSSVRDRNQQPGPMMLNDVVISMEPMVRQLLGPDVKLKTNLCETGGSILAEVDRLEQILLNLVINARDAMPEGGALAIDTRDDVSPVAENVRGDRLESSPWVSLVVRDSGVGMSSEIQQRAFEAFFTTKPVGRGTGLGLSTMLEVVEALGGHVDLESQPGAGSTFSIYFPRDGQGASAR